MKFAQPLESQRLSFLLRNAASREVQMWKAYVSKIPSNQDTHVSLPQRDEAVRWLTDLQKNIKLYPETLSLAISILDRFLTTVKARPKYLRCIAIACFFLAIKTVEEDECIPSLQDLAKTSRCGCSPSEILRMERIILDKLNWDLHTATALDFLHIFYAMMLSCECRLPLGLLGMNAPQHVSLLTQQLHHCLADHRVLQMKGSMLAVAIISLEVEKCCPDWLALTIDLLKKAQIDSSQIIQCRELVARSLPPHQASLPPNILYIYQPLQQSQASCSWGPPLSQHHLPGSPPLSSRRGKWVHLCPGLARPCVPGRLRNRPLHLSRKHSAKRKVEEMEVDEFYDGIRCLYSEDGNQEGAAGEGQGLACSSSLGWQDGSLSPCPPLQPAISVI
ncbi:cyclin-I [Paramormyrops kingsleyae]|uniref:Cyclin-I n=1 Tax=Paramormyrops kingsleyae TaxID=1676925 RepID=A0A3B3S3M9_9TELE|nr:cyclin-I [Paramormyrops kingsleyae]